MHELIQSTVLARHESGEAVSHLNVTRERNGCGVWYARVGFQERLIAWHHFNARTTLAQVTLDARNHAHTIAAECARCGDERFARDRVFMQC